MTFNKFIKEYKEDIDRVIDSYGGKYKNNNERRMVVLNDEGLYLLARRNGVRI